MCAMPGINGVENSQVDVIISGNLAGGGKVSSGQWQQGERKQASSNETKQPWH